MNTLKQFQEEGEKEFKKRFEALGLDSSLIEGYCTSQYYILDFLSQQTTLAYELGKKEAEQDFRKILNSGRKMYELGKKEMLEMVVKWCDKRCEENIRINGTDKWNSDLEDLKQKLLALNEE